MKKWILLLAAVPAFAFLPLLATAQIYVPSDFGAAGNAQGPGQPTTAAFVAMIFHKLAGRVPDVEKWALETDEYKKASSFDKQLVFEQELAKLKDIFRMSSLSEPIVIEREEKISEYSFENKGFTIDSFSPESYFPYVFAGGNYAVIIPGLMDQQWLGVAEDAAAMRIDTLAAKKAAVTVGAQRKINIRLHVEPRYADGRAPMVLDGKSYWLVSGVLKNIIIQDGDEIIWQKETASRLDELTPQNREMLELYRK